MQVIRADLFGTIVFAAIALLWIFNALRGVVVELGARRRSRPQRSPLQTLRGGATPGAQRSPLRAVFRRLSSASSAGAADSTLRRVAPNAAKPRSLPTASSSIRTTQAPGPATPGDGPPMQATGYLVQFGNPLWLENAVIAAIVLEPCAAHKGAGHEPGDW